MRIAGSGVLGVLLASAVLALAAAPAFAESGPDGKPGEAGEAKERVGSRVFLQPNVVAWQTFSSVAAEGWTAGFGSVPVALGAEAVIPVGIPGLHVTAGGLFRFLGRGATKGSHARLLAFWLEPQVGLLFDLERTARHRLGVDARCGVYVADARNDVLGETRSTEVGAAVGVDVLYHFRVVPALSLDVGVEFEASPKHTLRFDGTLEQSPGGSRSWQVGPFYLVGLVLGASGWF